MAFDPASTNLIPGLAISGGNITFPIASLPFLDAAKAADSRTLAFSFLERLTAWYAGLPTADKPARLSAKSGVAFNSNTLQPSKSYVVVVVQPTVAIEGIANEPA